MPPTLVTTSTLAPTATAFVPFTVTTWADNVFLRSNPGYLFPQLAVLRKDTSLQVLGKSPGAEWLLCQTSESRVGWVFAQLVDGATGNLEGLRPSGRHRRRPWWAKSMIRLAYQSAGFSFRLFRVLARDRAAMTQ